MKRLKRFFFPILLLPVLLALPVAAEEADTAQIYGEQLEASGADDLIDTLPEETRRFMEGLGHHVPAAGRPDRACAAERAGEPARPAGRAGENAACRLRGGAGGSCCCAR